MIDAHRIDQLLRGPKAIEAQRFFRLAHPLYKVAGWRADVRADALDALLTALREGPAAATLLEAAERELEANVIAVERVAIVQDRTPVAHALWLKRVRDVLTLAGEAQLDAGAARLVQRTDESAVLPPLVPLEEHRLVDAELAALEHLMAAARAETMVLGRKRRLLVAARQRLLDCSAALSLEREGVRRRARWIARQIARLDRLEAAGLSGGVSLVHQARQALERRDAKRLHAALAAVDAHALSAGDHAIASRTSRVLAPRMDDALASAEDLLGDAADLVRRAVDHGRGGALSRLGLGGTADDRAAADAYLTYLPDGADAQILRAAMAADGFFEVGGALSAVRIAEEERVLRVVRPPTEALVLVPAEDASDLADAVVVDPRSILLDLAAGRLLARRYVREEVKHRTRVVRRGEVRVYVLDGSGSMAGARARVRDALLVAELSTLMRRLAEPGDVHCTLYYRYFHEELGPVARIDSVQAARDAIRDVVTTKREGGTDIQKALVASLAQIAEARAADPDLAHAQIVLVTDGDAPVDEPALVAAQEALGLPIGVSVIALGLENPALRGLVARQRAKGERAFYHYLDDAELDAIVAEQSDDAIAPPPHWKTDDPAALGAILDEEAGGLVEELEAIDRAREHAALEQLEAEAQARREMELVETDAGALARLEALRRDRVALAARFARWFPEPTDAGEPLPRDRADLDAAACALASVAEVVALLGGTPLARQADAIELLERLLPDAGLGVVDYRLLLRRWPQALAASLRAVHDATHGP